MTNSGIAVLPNKRQESWAHENWPINEFIEPNKRYFWDCITYLSAHRIWKMSIDLFSADFLFITGQIKLEIEFCGGLIPAPQANEKMEHFSVRWYTFNLWNGPCACMLSVCDIIVKVFSIDLIRSEWAIHRFFELLSHCSGTKSDCRIIDVYLANGFVCYCFEMNYVIPFHNIE